jgi:hypothetical protein
METKNTNDINQMKGDMEKLTRHLNKQERINEDNSIMLLNIQTALLGTEFNEKKGMVFILNDIDKRVKVIERKQGEYDIYVSQGKWALGIVATVLVSFGLYILKKINAL